MSKKQPHFSSLVSSSSGAQPAPPPPLLTTSIQLAIPNMVLRPSLDDIQVFVSRGADLTLSNILEVLMCRQVHRLVSQQDATQDWPCS